VAGSSSGFLDGGAATQNDDVGERDLLPAGLGAVEILLYRFKLLPAKDSSNTCTLFATMTSKISWAKAWHSASRLASL